MTTHKALQAWINEIAELTQPDSIYWCNGSESEFRELTRLLLSNGGFVELNQETHPGCYLHRSDPSDVARVEHLTFVCTSSEADAGPNNNWMAPNEARAKLRGLFRGCMKGRTMYVIPYCMGPIESPLSRCGVEVTDSAYVVANMNMMTRMGDAALRRIEREGTFVKGLHSIGDLNPERRFIMHFPEDLEIQSFGSGYGGNALLGKKCHALRIASYQAKTEGWLAEHMLIVGVESPAGEVHYIAAAFPSACGKTNLAMMIPPSTYKGWKIWTLGDDICWMRVGEDGRMWAINPESGFFGVAPGTARTTNPNALAMLDHDAIFTNVAVTGDGQPWWEGLDGRVPAKDWMGEPFEPRNGPAAHPNSRFTVRMSQCPSYSDQAEAPGGVPLSAIIFGGRRARLVPLVMESESWTHGVLMGASMASETTAAATDTVGVVRRDPMAMKPFCGYNFADYWAHWLSFEGVSDKLPKIFTVNWFRKDAGHRFMWPGFGDNMRVLEWIVRRCKSEVGAVHTPIGRMPDPADINLDGIRVAPATMRALLDVDIDAWKAELAEVGEYIRSYGDRTPAALKTEWERISTALNAA
ncbi:MAG: phosphoenolpyruvate carboxykinase (GTP) [Lysobacterales bacterium]|nr:MAG: phosphoenolpyruvate carboxykinase (GTP) [Xanthomonadales bacterium]